jgi:hypothetical protein
VGRHGLLCWQGAADRPIAAILHSSAMPNGVLAHTLVLVGRRLTQAVGLAALSVGRFSSPPQGFPPSTTRVNCGAPRAIASVIRSHRPAFSYQPRPLVNYPHRVRFAAAPPRASPLPTRLDTADSCRACPCEARCQKRCIECVPTAKRRPGRSAQPSLQPAGGNAAIFHPGSSRSAFPLGSTFPPARG